MIRLLLHTCVFPASLSNDHLWSERRGLYHMLVEITNHSKNVQVSCPLLELCGRHMVMFQVKVPQIFHIKQFIYDVAKSFTVWFSAQNRDFF